MSTRISGSLVRGAPATRSEKVRTYAPGRICAIEGCFTVLSIYNPSRFCGLHAAPDRTTSRRKPLRPVRQCACEHCGTGFETTNPVRKYCSDRCRMAAFAARQRNVTSGRPPEPGAIRHETLLSPDILEAAGVDVDAA